MSEKQPQAMRDALDVSEFSDALQDWLQAYIREHPDVCLASIQMGLRLIASDFALYSILSSPPQKDKEA